MGMQMGKIFRKREGNASQAAAFVPTAKPPRLHMWARLGGSLAVCCAAAAVVTAAVVTAQGTPRADPVLGPGDIVDIQVFREPELTLTGAVSETGEIRYPLLGTVQAQGQTAHELADHIGSRLVLEGFLLHASVNVLIRERRSAAVTLSGAVREPGTYPLSPGQRLRDFIGHHGGLDRERAGLELVVRNVDGATQTIGIRALFEPENDEDWDNDILLQSGAEILVPHARKFYVQGAVARPQAYFLREPVTLIGALGLAGGWTKSAGTHLVWQRYDEKGTPEPIVTVPIRDLYDGEPIGRAPVGPGDMIHVGPADSFHIAGEVRDPGSYACPEGLTLSRAIAIADGLTLKGSKAVRIKRRNDKPGRSPEKYSLSEIRKGKAPDPSIHAGDVILVNRNWLSIPLLIKELSPFGSATRF